MECRREAVMRDFRGRDMQSLFLCLILLLFFSPNLRADTAQNCTLRGRVVNAAGNQPLKNVRVQLKSADDPKRFYNVTTDAQGQFVFLRWPNRRLPASARLHTCEWVSSFTRHRGWAEWRCDLLSNWLSCMAGLRVVSTWRMPLPRGQWLEAVCRYS